jgi:hypothetical protein
MVGRGMPPKQVYQVYQTHKTRINIGSNEFRKCTQSVPNPYQVYLLEFMIYDLMIYDLVP